MILWLGSIFFHFFSLLKKKRMHVVFVWDPSILVLRNTLGKIKKVTHQDRK